MDPEKLVTEIPELVRVFKALFRIGEFDEVQDILMDREKNLKIELECLRRERDLMKEKCELMGNSSSLDGFRRSRKEWEELKAELRIWKDKDGGLRDRLRKADERSERYVKVANVQNEVISKLRAEISELKDLTMVAEKLKGEKLVAHQTVEKLRHENLEAYGTIEELRSEKLGLNKDIEDMKLIQAVADETIQELRRRNSEAVNAINMLRTKQTNSHEIIEKLRSQNHQALIKVDELEKRVERLKFEKVEDDNALDEMKQKLSRADRRMLESSDTIQDLKQCISGLEKTVDGMKHRESKDDQTIYDLRSKHRQALEKTEEMERRVERLKLEQVAADYVLKETKEKLSRAEQTVEQMRKMNLEASGTIGRLKHNIVGLEETIKGMRHRQSLDDRTIKDLWTQLSGSSVTIKHLRDKLSLADHTILELTNGLSQTSVTVADLRGKLSKDDQTIQELRSQSSEASATAADLRVKQSNAEKTNQELRCLNLEAANIIKQLTQRLSKSDEIMTEMRLTQEKSAVMIEELKHQSLVAQRKAEELSFQKFKADKASERKKKKLGELVPITMKMEEFSALLKDKIDYLANPAKPEENSFANGDANFICSEDGKQSVENTGVGSSNAGLLKTANSRITGESGNKNLDSPSLIKDEGADVKNTETSYQAGRYSTRTPLAENCVLDGKKEMKIISLSGLEETRKTIHVQAPSWIDSFIVDRPVHKAVEFRS